MALNAVCLVIFTCEGREHLLRKTYESFLSCCDYQFERVILAIDGIIDPAVTDFIHPDLVINSYKRKGYVTSIKNTLSSINTPFFFWLEDDWNFRARVDVPYLVGQLAAHSPWVQIVYSKNGPLTADLKFNRVGINLYENIYGFSANPCFNRSQFLKDGFSELEAADKGDTLGENGFENFLTKYSLKTGAKCIILDPADHLPISHEGYLESTPRNWHMTNSLESKTKKYLLTIAEPSMLRRLFMVFKLSKAFLILAVKQLWNNEFYELGFRVINSITLTNKNVPPGNNNSNR